MNLAEYISMNKGIQYSEIQFLELVFYPLFGSYGLNYLDNNTPFQSSEGTTKFIDFTIKTKYAKYAIEIDDYGTHGANIGRENFEMHNLRQNDITSLGYKLLRFSLDSVKNKYEKCKNQLRQMFLPDEELNYQAISKYNKKITPSEPQEQALDKLEKFRNKGYKRGIIVHATGLGKTFLSAFELLI